MRVQGTVCGVLHYYPYENDRETVPVESTASAKPMASPLRGLTQVGPSQVGLPLFSLLSFLDRLLRLAREPLKASMWEKTHLLWCRLPSDAYHKQRLTADLHLPFRSQQCPMLPAWLGCLAADATWHAARPPHDSAGAQGRGRWRGLG